MTQPFNIEDLYQHKKILEVDCIEQAEAAIGAVQTVDRGADSYATNLWHFPFDGTKPRQLTQGKGTNESPRWAPDGSRWAFLSDRAGSTQIFVMDGAGGEPVQLSRLPQSVSNLRWAPDGSRLIVTAAVLVDPDAHGAPSRTEEHGSQKKSSPEVAWRLPYKEDGVGYILGREFHLFSVDAKSGRHVQLTDGAFDVLAFDVAEDGRIAYTRTGDGRAAHRNDLWTCDKDGRDQRRISNEHAIVMQPCWSPDGRRIAFSGAIEEGDAEPRLWLADLEKGVISALCSESVDVADPQSVRWMDDGRLIFIRAHRGCHEVVEVDIATEETTVLTEARRQLSAFGCTSKRLVFCIDHPSLPGELWLAPLNEEGQGRLHVGKERQISSLNPWWLERQPIEARLMEFEVPDGLGGSEVIEGWLLRAEGSKGAQPLLNDVHGGPASYALLDYDTNVFWQVLCSKGWSVLALNAVGSASYGREFCSRLAGRWGTLDLPQHLAAVQQLQKQGLCSQRVAISGKSYGGYLSGFATGNSEAFCAAVVMAPVGNIETHYGTSDGGYYADPFYMDSKPAFDRGLARKLSPLDHIERSKTPTLFMQGKDDERCPKCQSEELFVSLARAGDTATQLVLYPGETHSFLGSGTPSCREDAATRIVDWVRSHSEPPDAR